MRQERVVGFDGCRATWEGNRGKAPPQALRMEALRQLAPGCCPAFSNSVHTCSSVGRQRGCLRPRTSSSCGLWGEFLCRWWGLGYKCWLPKFMISSISYLKLYTQGKVSQSLDCLFLIYLWGLWCWTKQSNFKVLKMCFKKISSSKELILGFAFWTLVPNTNRKSGKPFVGTQVREHEEK